MNKLAKKKRRRKRNPLLQKKFDEGYELGVEHGRMKAVEFFTYKFEGLENIDGIGEKTMDKIRGQLGNKYFGESGK